LRICPNCLVTFLPANQFAALRRELNDSTKAAWIRKLNEKPQPLAPLEGKFCCIDHNTPLVKGTLPNYSFEGLLPACCDLQHVQPPIMAKVLEMGLGAPSGASMGGLVGVRRHKANGISKFLGGIVFHFWEKKQKNKEDGLDRLQYEFKFKEALGEWIEAS
jgi:hypothetical protein